MILIKRIEYIRYFIRTVKVKDEYSISFTGIKPLSKASTRIEINTSNIIGENMKNEMNCFISRLNLNENENYNKILVDISSNENKNNSYLSLEGFYILNICLLKLFKLHYGNNLEPSLLDKFIHFLILPERILFTSNYIGLNELVLQNNLIKNISIDYNNLYCSAFYSFIKMIHAQEGELHLLKFIDTILFTQLSEFDLSQLPPKQLKSYLDYFCKKLSLSTCKYILNTNHNEVLIGGRICHTVKITIDDIIRGSSSSYSIQNAFQYAYIQTLAWFINQSYTHNIDYNFN